jgi:hypothetical protein
VYDVIDHTIDIDFRKVYGQAFGFLDDAKPSSVLLAEGSEVLVRGGRRL